MKEDEFKFIQKSLPAKEKILSNGHTYYYPDSGDKMIELYVDNHDCLQQWDHNKYGLFGVSVSFCMPQGLKPIIVFGQDETDFNVLILNVSMWISPDGEWSILPKINSIGVMVSAFQSRDIGFGIKMSDVMIKLINKRHSRKHYFDKVVSQYVPNTT